MLALALGGVLLGVGEASFGDVRRASGPGAAHAQETPPPSWARSLEVVASGVTVRAAPSVRAARRGTVRTGTRLESLGWTRGEGCPSGGWHRVGADAFVCEGLVRPSAEAPGGEALPVVPPGALLPRVHAFVGADGTWAYARPDDYFSDEWSESLGRGFGLAVGERRVLDGVAFARSLGGLWVPEDQLRFARGSDFEGAVLEGTLDVAWIAREGVAVRAWNGARTGAVVRRARARERVRVLGLVPGGRVRIEDGVVEVGALRWPRPVDVPAEVAADERWIDIRLGAQTLVLYEGARPVFATLVSSGRGGPGHATPTGSFRIWVKLAEDTMDDLDRDDVETNYAIEGVPWVQYFAEGVALHAAFWHDDFGRPRSHGCVNLSPRDARRLFALTGPTLPPGWDAVLSTPSDPGTLVRVAP